MRFDWNERARSNPRWYIASDAQDDEEFRNSGRRDTDFCLRDLPSNWLKKARALEIGCGAGRMTEFIARRVGHLTATDVSTEMIELARARCREARNLLLKATNGEDLSDFEDRSFDLILSYVVFQHVPKRVACSYFLEARRVLSDSGIFRVQLAEINDPAYVPPDDSDTFTMRSWTRDEAAAGFEGWARVEVEVVQASPTTDHLWVTAST
jgi:ubiquinone/menaquinone biosynthesis C-methylase UbiE